MITLKTLNVLLQLSKYYIDKLFIFVKWALITTR